MPGASHELAQAGSRRLLFEELREIMGLMRSLPGIFFSSTGCRVLVLRYSIKESCKEPRTTMLDMILASTFLMPKTPSKFTPRISHTR